MTFLQLCQEFRGQAGIAGTGPTTVADQTGILLRIVNAVADAWLRIQKHPKQWKWMWRYGYDLETIANTPDYVLTGVDEIFTDTVTAYKQSLGTSSRFGITFWDWAKYKQVYGNKQVIPTGKPSVMTQLPNGNLRFYPKPDAVYVVDFEYLKSPQVLDENTDTPEMPSEFHQLIVFDAMIHFGGLQDADELVNTASTQYQVLMNRLIWDQELRRSRFMTVVPE